MKNKLVGSSVFRKFVMGITGLLLVGFIITHLSANLLLLQPAGTLFNGYAAKLAAFGPLLYAAEIGLGIFFVYHAFTGIRLALQARAARPVKYAVARSKGGESKWGPAANHMAVTGTVLFVFTVLHVLHFKFGKSIDEGYVTQLDGQSVRDLHRYVVEEFRKPLMVGLYVAAMAFLGFHLRHGVWSALQSLGLTRVNNSRTIYIVGGIVGILLAVGFLVIPIYLYFFGPQ